MSQDPKSLLTDYAAVIELYDRLATEVARRLKHLCQSVGLRPAITHRAKDIRSLIKKCLLYDGPVERVPDKAGVKVIVRYAVEVDRISSLLLSDAFVSEAPDVKARHYKPNELGYLGTHHQVTLPPHDCPSELIGLECEIIIHTGAEALWDGVSHELMYKPLVELASEAQRSLNRLLVLVELFDKEVTSVRHEYLSSPAYREAYMLDILEKYFYQIDAREYQRDMSIRMLQALAPALDEEKMARLDDEIGTFFHANLAALQNTYRKHQDADDLSGLFLHQPESLLIFAMFSWHQKDAVKKAWLTLYPRSYLEELGSLWGTSIPR